MEVWKPVAWDSARVTLVGHSQLPQGTCTTHLEAWTSVKQTTASQCLACLTCIFTLHIFHVFVLPHVSTQLRLFVGVVLIEYHRQSSKGYPMKVDWSAEEHKIKNKKAIETHELDRFRSSVWCNTLLLWSIGLYWLSYDIACVLRGYLPALYSWR